MIPYFGIPKRRPIIPTTYQMETITSNLFPCMISRIVGLPITDIDASANKPDANMYRLISA